ncbi:hypothetical protein ONZ45_g14671 [Pleurotus djamor]|nr:hypothetical protein ONZ45_g14671 [Pleurotus djamor]
MPSPHDLLGLYREAYDDSDGTASVDTDSSRHQSEVPSESEMETPSVPQDIVKGHDNASSDAKKEKKEKKKRSRRYTDEAKAIDNEKRLKRRLKAAEANAAIALKQQRLAEKVRAIVKAELESYAEKQQEELSRVVAVASSTHIAEVLQALFGQKVHVHWLEKNPKLLEDLSALEAKTFEPLDRDHAEFPNDRFVWLSEPGVHLGLLYNQVSKTRMHPQIVFMVKIRSFEEYASQELETMTSHLETLMNWTLATNAIKNNAAHNKGVKAFQRATNVTESFSELQVNDAQPHGNYLGEAEVVKKKEVKTFGTMYAAGWHGAMEKGKKLVYYASASTNIGRQMFADLLPKLPAVAQMYRDKLLSLIPIAADRLLSYATEYKSRIPSFADATIDGDSTSAPFANSLTITRDDFGNFLHRDRDAIDIAFGIWWCGVLRDGKYVLDTDIDHNRVIGGAFIWGLLGYGVDFQRCRGPVEIYWRGKEDEHATMRSSSPTNITRFGTSVQITEGGARAVQRIWEANGDPLLVTNAYDRIKAASTR